MRDGYKIDNQEAVAAVKIKQLAEKYGAIILTDLVDFEEVDNLMLIDEIFAQKG